MALENAVKSIRLDDETSSSIGGLPLELVQEVCKYLDREALEALSLVNKASYSATEIYLFRKITFAAPWDNAIATVKKLRSDEVKRSSVRIVQFVPACRYEVDEATFNKAYEWTRRDESLTAEAAWEKFIASQEISNTQKLLDKIYKEFLGVEPFPNVKSIRIVGPTEMRRGTYFPRFHDTVLNDRSQNFGLQGSKVLAGLLGFPADLERIRSPKFEFEVADFLQRNGPIDPGTTCAHASIDHWAPYRDGLKQMCYHTTVLELSTRACAILEVSLQSILAYCTELEEIEFNVDSMGSAAPALRTLRGQRKLNLKRLTIRGHEDMTPYEHLKQQPDEADYPLEHNSFPLDYMVSILDNAPKLETLVIQFVGLHENARTNPWTQHAELLKQMRDKDSLTDIVLIGVPELDRVGPIDHRRMLIGDIHQYLHGTIDVNPLSVTNLHQVSLPKNYRPVYGGDISKYVTPECRRTWMRPSYWGNRGTGHQALRFLQHRRIQIADSYATSEWLKRRIPDFVEELEFLELN